MKKLPYPVLSYRTRKPEPMITRTMWIMFAGIIAAGPFACLICRIVGV